jgi:squamous cell carcinoma antigen recognized by T-cells 3
MEDTFQEFSSFISRYQNDNYEKIMASTSKDYGKALKALREREIFEMQLQQTGYSNETYFAYLQWELSNAPKVHITPLTKTLFERALAIWWQQSSIWEDYAHFVIKKKFEEDEVAIVLDRAIRNCQWSGDLWSLNMRFQAQIQTTTFEDLANLKGRAIDNSYLIANPNELAKLFYAWITICNLKAQDVDIPIDDITTVIDEVRDCLERVGPGFDWPEGYLFGRLAVDLIFDTDQREIAATIWENMAKINGTKCNFWLDRIQWEWYRLRKRI